MSRRALFLSIKPEFVDRILCGHKTVELRRVRPRVEPGTPVVIYASSPRMAVEAVATIEELEASPPARLWSLVRRGADTSRSGFDWYFRDKNKRGHLIPVGYGIFLRDVTRLDQPVPLSAIRRRIADFHPPQGYLYVDLDRTPWNRLLR